MARIWSSRTTLCLLIGLALLDISSCQLDSPGPFLTQFDNGVSVRIFNLTKTEKYVYGGLELSTNQQTWGFPCHENFETETSRVICRMFNYTRGEAISGSRLGTSAHSRFPHDFRCSGHEESLTLCEMDFTNTFITCHANESVGILCFNNISDVLQMRLSKEVRTPVQMSGRLEVRLSPVLDWGSVCDDTFTDQSAQSACRYLGFKIGEISEDKGEGSTASETLLDEVSCSAGQEFLDCNHNIWGIHDCNRVEDVAISCIKTNVRLLSLVKTDSHLGTVELYNEKERGWFEVCGVGWKDSNAKVVCREVGFTDGKALQWNSLGAVAYGSFTAAGSYTNVSCDGTESTLSQCSLEETTLCEFRDSIIDLASVICYNTSLAQVDMTDAVRIASDAGASSDAGFLELRHFGVWGRVCDGGRNSKFSAVSDREATVACKMMGYVGGKRLGPVTSADKHHIWLRGFQCQGNESAIAQCSTPDWGAPGDSCDTPVRVVCFRKDLNLHLTQFNNQTGLLSVVHDERTSGVCADNWTNLEADAACKVLKFTGGRTWTPQTSQSINSRTVIGSVSCDSSDETFYKCVKDKWEIDASQCHKGQAGVSCFTNVKLDPGWKNTGILQVFNQQLDAWETVCRSGFTNVSATIACRQLGFKLGTVLPAGVFGSYYSSNRRFNVSCRGQESSISDCPYDNITTAGCNLYSSYTSISCFDEISTDLKNSYSLETNQSSNVSGVVKVYQNNTWGYVCEEMFTDDDARVYCSEIGKLTGQNFQRGIKFDAGYDITGPYFHSFPNCSSNDTVLQDCKSSRFLCSAAKAAAVLCFTSGAPSLNLVEDHTQVHSGRLQLTIGSETGAICGDKWTDHDAEVACKMINPNFVTGIAKLYDRSNLEFFMSGLQCSGSELSLFHCKNDGWRSKSNVACQGSVKEAGVICSTNVILTNATFTRESISGKLVITKYSRQYDVCYDMSFTFKMAELACSELGYRYAAILKPAATDDLSRFYMMKTFYCTESAKSLAQCQTSVGYCSHGHVRLLCYQNPLNDLNRWSYNSQAPGRLRSDILDTYSGVICPVNFRDADAIKICKANGYMSGKSLSSTQITETSGRELVWFGPPKCSTLDGGVEQCSLQMNVSRECLSKSYSAGVLCLSNSDSFGYRLMDNTRQTLFAGRVEMKVDNVWGTVCNQHGGWLQARVLCRELGFIDGVVLPSSPKRYGNGTGPIYLKDVACNHDDSHFLGCLNAGWSETSNCTHADDLEVICYTKERFYPFPENHYGAVSLISNGAYRLICSDNFTDTEASVFCSAMGYIGGVSICCSGISVPHSEIGISHMHCGGSEKSLINCSFAETLEKSSCPSQLYASAACSLTPQSENYALSLEKSHYGRININYYSLNKFMCHNNLTKNIAQVVCREAGYNNGMAFVSAGSADFTWAAQIECQGSEARIDRCSKFSLGKTKPCQMIPSVYCLRNNEDDSMQLQLRDGTSKNMGRLEVQIGGVWGSVCIKNTLSANHNAAAVICKELGYKDGKVLPPGTFSQNAGQIWLAGINCTGSETSFKDCQLVLYTNEDSDCQSHLFDLAIECYLGARLVNGPPNAEGRGQLQIQDNTTGSWQYVCDAGVTDTEATVVCASLGYKFGKQQCCSAAGRVSRLATFVTSISCRGTETDVNKCSITRGGTCSSQNYAYVHCSNTAFLEENFLIGPMESFVGVPKVHRYGIEGYICAQNVTDTEAAVMCRDMGYVGGRRLWPANASVNEVCLLNGLNCTGQDRNVSRCTYPSMASTGTCFTRQSAQILCQRTFATISYRISSETSAHSGRAEIIIDDKPFLIESRGLGSDEASVFCRSVNAKMYAYGSLYSGQTADVLPSLQVMMSSVICQGNESSILDCKANFTLKYLSSSSKVAHFICHRAVELEQGPTHSAGILTLYNAKLKDFGAICNNNFGQNETTVACRMLGFENGLTHCCLPFGYNYYDIYHKNFKCTGQEQSLFECHYDSAQVYTPYFCSGRQDYVGLTCYNGTKPRDFTLALVGSSSNAHTGLLRVTYLETQGSVCNDKWNDSSARVACRELGFLDGKAYTHFRPSFTLNDNAGPFWISNVECSGNESRLADCKHTAVGDVTSCSSGHFAGLLCTKSGEIEFRISGTDKAHYGRVEISINGVWGSLCDRYWDSRDASVLCRQLGFVNGDVFETSGLVRATGPVWEISPRCVGKETNINMCPHEGWKSNISNSCSGHMRDAGVFCYTSVKLGTGAGKSFFHGPVHYFENGEWYKICDDGFTDMSARKVCQELGFYDGQALCCSAYDGETASLEAVHANVSIQCSGEEASLKDCVRMEVCRSGLYASVACFEINSTKSDQNYSLSLVESSPGIGTIGVTYLGVSGRVCSHGWTDKEAKVFCKEKRYDDGFAYYHSYAESYISASSLGPYWLSNVTCQGSEARLIDCQHQGRLTLGNCTKAHSAAVVCFSTTGVQYRLKGANSNQTNSGRIEMAIDDKWGTICGRSWDNRDAGVACKQIGFTDGEAEAPGKYGRGDGPTWLRDIHCKGDESALHKCPHTGFQADPPEQNAFPWLPTPCSDHNDDATLFCFQDVKLQQKLGVTSGALLYSHNKRWVYICDSDTFTQREAKVACKSLLQNFVDGVAIRGGLFGDMDAALSIGVTSVTCSGPETSLSQCQVTSTGNCTSKTYISVACFTQPLTSEDFKFKVRLSDDTIKTNENHGILEVRVNGAWGRVCNNNFTELEANVACKQIGNYTGGVPYLHLFRNRLPVLWNQVTCSGHESSLDQCQHSSLHHPNCSYESNDAGVICYRGEGVKYRLRGGKSAQVGRVEIGIDGKFGTVCGINWHAANSRVLCRSLGYVDGVPSHEVNSSLTSMDPYMSFFLCDGTEKNLFSCLNSGFDGGNHVFICGGDSYTQCYNEEVKITNFRIGDGQESEGRVEVFASGMGVWGTVCDDDWDDTDAGVFCRALGFDDGVARSGSYKLGTGDILLDDVSCKGTEKSFSQCQHKGIATHNCEHSEDAGVQCFNHTRTTTVQVSTTGPPTTVRTTPTPKPTMTTTLPLTTTKLSTPSTTTASTTTTTSSSTSTTTPSDLETQQQADQEEKKNTVVIAACIVIVVAITLIVVIVVVVLRYKGHFKLGIPHERFHNEIEQTQDMSVAVPNRMFDISNPSNFDPMSQYMAEGPEVHLDRAGYVTFSKGTPPETKDQDGHTGFVNPLYSAVTQPVTTDLDHTDSSHYSVT
ncbi:uncharacterized protein LOC131954198 isoform X1 [Physella acuta]|uniref:uncharacterized protein LOC131954198 isoform X1 n=3 Tax=Physella acuta TaxID=109671 RepID=UPI0027DDB7C1|nr:uncharacterized protein LOC131954198 isoform X1 [Physella acuta]XP_059173742.1 uncharacterized protein LOC131954198 isoform X1 [Physella acuta]